MNHDDNTTRNTTDGSHIGGSFNWDFNHINNRHSRLISNARLTSTFDERYYFPRRRIGFGGALISLCVVAVSLYLLVVEVGLLDGVYLWLTN